MEDYSHGCGRCGVKLCRHLNRCPVCRHYGTVFSTRRRVEAEPASRLRSRTLDQAAVPRNVRISTGGDGLDRVLGGGLRVPSSVLLAGGEGSGKSTLLLPAAAETRALYVAAEEHEGELRERADRVPGLAARLHRIRVLESKDLHEILEEARVLRPRVAFLDSINRVRHPDVNPANEDLTRAEIIRALDDDAKYNDRVWVTVAQLNKEDGVAGRRANLHDPDVILVLESLNKRERRLGVHKNRFGATTPVAFYDIVDGMRELDRTEEDEERDQIARHVRRSVMRPDDPGRGDAPF